MAYRTSVHDSTGFSPSLMMLGREPELPIDLLFGSSPQIHQVLGGSIYHCFQIK